MDSISSLVFVSEQDLGIRPTLLALAVACVCVCASLQVPPSPASEVVFHQAWAKIVDDLRSRDLLSNAEAANLKFMHLSWGRNRETAWLLLPRYWSVVGRCSCQHPQKHSKESTHRMPASIIQPLAQSRIVTLATQKRRACLCCRCQGQP